MIKKNIILIIYIFLTLNSCKSDKSEVAPEIQNEVFDQESDLLSLYKKEGDAYILPWKNLMSVKFEERYDEKMSMEVSIPMFNDTLSVLDGKMVIAEGFYIPVDETGDEKIVILSAFPFSQCFFCGKAGIESIIDVLTPKKLPVLKMDAKIRFKGKFKLNKDNFDFLIYMLEDATLLTE